ncbi:hypothetical protein OIU76_009963 [Salix suchowensis]|nr:hypothetical protein OIU76_009963 [Salix suchowensis]
MCHEHHDTIQLTKCQANIVFPHKKDTLHSHSTYIHMTKWISI